MPAGSMWELETGMRSSQLSSMSSMDRPGTVYFLGAGASKAFHPDFPLAGELKLDYLLQSSNYDEGRTAPDLAIRQLEGFLEKSPEPSRIRSQPFEKLLGEFQVESEPYYPYENSLICLCRLLSLENRSLSGPVLDDWLRKVREQHCTIITTNYDTAVEDVLSNLGTGELPLGALDALDRDALHWLDYGVSKRLVYRRREPRRWRNPPEGSILFLKLHGSISWLYCVGCCKYVLDRMHQHAMEYAISAYGKCPSCNKATLRQTVIVPPVEAKKYEDVAIRTIWRRARKELRATEEVTFAGFSLNPVDSGIQELLSKAYVSSRIRKVRIVDPHAEKLLPRYRELYPGARIDTFNMSWKDYLLHECRL